jgi:hypothetical protein
MSYKHPPKKLACYLERHVHERAALIHALVKSFLYRKSATSFENTHGRIFFSRKQLSFNCVATLSGWLCSTGCLTFEVMWLPTATRTLHKELAGGIVQLPTRVLLLLHAEALTFYWNLADWAGGGGRSSFYDTLLYNRTPWDAVSCRDPYGW